MNPYIALCGTHSVGKTTTVEATIPILEQLYNKPVYYISEVSRKIKEKYGVKLNKEATSGTQRLIESTYKDEEDINSDKVLISDRTVIDRFAYTLLGNTAKDDDLLEWYKRNIKKICEQYTFIFHVPLTDDLKLAADGTRDLDEAYRQQVAEVQKRTIEDYGVKVYDLVGSTEERVETIKSVLLTNKSIFNGTGV